MCSPGLRLWNVEEVCGGVPRYRELTGGPVMRIGALGIGRVGKRQSKM